MYNIGMPILFLIGAINFFMQYWVDKWLLLRFHKTPRNYDEQTIDFTLSYIKVAFFFHFIIGFLMISNDAILSSDNTLDQYIQDSELELYGSGITKHKLSRFSSAHTILFVVCNGIFLIGMIF